MKVFITALPLFDADMAVQAYRLCDRSGETAMSLQSGDFRRMSESLRSPGLDLVEQIGPEPFAADKPLFVDVTGLRLLTGFPEGVRVPPERLVCALPGDTRPDGALLARCAALRERGVPLALDGFPPEGIMSPLLGFASYVILDYAGKYFDTWYRLAQKLGRIRTVVSGVPDRGTYEELSANRDALFSGGFYSRPVTEGVAELSPVKINALRLLNMVNTEDFELADIARIIERDPYLTVSLLKFINRGAFRRANRVDSIMSAVAILGQREVRRWATVAISMGLAEDRPGEIARLSLIRAKFAENLAPAFELGVLAPSLFMAGLFSLIDVILQKPMAEAVSDIAVDNRVRRVLVSGDGELAPVMTLMDLYERAEWNAVSVLLIQSGVGIDALNGAYTDAMLWYHNLLDQLDDDRPAESDSPQRG